MLRHLLLIGLLFISVLGTSQEDEYDDRVHSFGFDVTSTLTNVFSLSSEENFTPYTLVLKRELSETYGWRMGFSFGVIRETTFTDFTFGSRTISQQMASMRYGLEWYYPLGKNFHFFYGGDILVGFERDFSKVSGGFPGSASVTELTYSGGLGPVIGMEYIFNDLIKIGTESTLYGIYSYRTTEVFDNVGSEKTESNNISIQHILPQSLYLYITF